MSDNKVFNTDEQAKLKHLMTEGISVLSEVEALSGGLADTIKAIAEEMDIKEGKEVFAVVKVTDVNESNVF